MPKAAIIKDPLFTLVTEFARPDAKKRVTISDAVGAVSASAFNIYRNSVGQIVLDPVRAVPETEAWLWENPRALAAVRKGLKESAEGKSVYRGSFAKHAD